MEQKKILDRWPTEAMEKAGMEALKQQLLNAFAAVNPGDKTAGNVAQVWTAMWDAAQAGPLVTPARLKELLAAELTVVDLGYTYQEGNEAWTPPAAGLPPHLKSTGLEEQFRQVLVALGFPKAADLAAGDVLTAAIAAMKPFEGVDLKRDPRVGPFARSDVGGPAEAPPQDLGRDLWRRSLLARGFNGPHSEWTDEEIDEAAHRVAVEHRRRREHGIIETKVGREAEKELVRQVIREELDICLRWARQHDCPAELTVELRLRGETFADDTEEI